MFWLWEILKIAFKMSVFILGLVAFFSGPAIERSEDDPENWTLNTKFHKLTNLRALIFRILGLVIAYFGCKWLFSTQGSALKSEHVARVIFGFGFVLALFQSLIIILFGERYVAKLKDFQGMIDLEVMPARLWGLTFFIACIVFLIWIAS
jgi:hypothetical protein